MSARREIAYFFEIEGRLAQTDVSGTLVVRLNHSVPIDSPTAWLAPAFTLPVVVKEVISGKGELTAAVAKTQRAETVLPDRSVMMVGASHEGKLFRYRAGRWAWGGKPTTEFRAGHDAGSSSMYLRRSADGLKIVYERSGSLPGSNVNFNLLFVEVDRINHGKYISAYVFSPVEALKAILIIAGSLGVWIVLIAVLLWLL